MQCFLCLQTSRICQMLWMQLKLLINWVSTLFANVTGMMNISSYYILNLLFYSKHIQMTEKIRNGPTCFLISLCPQVCYFTKCPRWMPLMVLMIMLLVMEVGCLEVVSEKKMQSPVSLFQWSSRGICGNKAKSSDISTLFSSC